MPSTFSKVLFGIIAFLFLYSHICLGRFVVPLVGLIACIVDTVSYVQHTRAEDEKVDKMLKKVLPAEVPAEGMSYHMDRMSRLQQELEEKRRSFAVTLVVGFLWLVMALLGLGTIFFKQDRQSSRRPLTLLYLGIFLLALVCVFLPRYDIGTGDQSGHQLLIVMALIGGYNSACMFFLGEEILDDFS